MLGGLSIGHITMADIIPFRRRFEIDAEAAVAAALFGTDSLEHLALVVAGQRADIAERLASSKTYDDKPA
jgi:hypothetical protein